MSMVIPPSQRQDVFPGSAPHFDALNSRHRREEFPKYPESVHQRSNGRAQAQVLQLPIRPVPFAGRLPKPVPVQLRPGYTALPYPDRRSSRMASLSTESTPDLRHSMHRQSTQSSATSIGTVRYGPSHGQPEFRPVSTYERASVPFVPPMEQRVRTVSNPSPSKRSTSTPSSSNGEAWCSSAPEVPNFSRKIPIKKASTASSSSDARDFSAFSPPPRTCASPDSQQSMGSSGHRAYKPSTSSPLRRSKSSADLQPQKASTSQLPPSPPKPPAPNRPPSSASIRAEDEWRNAANVPPFSRNALKDSSIIMPKKASELKNAKEKEQNLKRLKRGSKSNVDLRSSAQTHQATPRKSKLIVTNPDTIVNARPVRFERPPSCLRNSVASSQSPQLPRAPKKVRIAEDPAPQLPATPADSELLSEFTANLERIGSTFLSPSPVTSPVAVTPKYVRRRSNSLPNGAVMMQKKDTPKLSDWLDSSSDELKRFLCPSPSPPSNSPKSSPPRSTRKDIAEKAATLAQKPVPLLRFSKSGGDLKLEYTRPPMPPLPKLNTHFQSGNPRPSHLQLRPPMYNSIFMERTNSGATSSSSSSHDTCSTDRSMATIASSKTSLNTTSSMFTAAKPLEKPVHLPPPPKSSADLWRQSESEEEVQQPRTIIQQAPTGNPPTDPRRKAIKPEKRPTLISKLACGLGFGSRKATESKRVRCNCGTTTVNLHYKKYHTSNGDGAGLL
ncbi:hypothetical protein SCHPADRAFT_366162 [Schizopora paradoxa]|uniref:Uncharacterized protein n=1 Tax=Schizopora paradoxa TaxID=27342 RepID=A0A0H2RN45_9AGAM|nr:hypothetical protein SCHPADRAFT_366162 [Schizopora paradoxa]